MNASSNGGQPDVLTAAHHDHESVIELTRDLIAIPSRGGSDSYDPVLDRVRAWLDQRNLTATVLDSGG